MMLPAVVVLEVNETLSDVRRLGERFAQVGARSELVDTWFSTVLRDGFASTAAGIYAEFGAVAESAAISLLSATDGLSMPVESAARHVLAGMAELPVHPDVPLGLACLHGAGIRLITLTNGSRAYAARVLERAGVAGLVEQNLSVDEVGRWKPAPEPYHYATARCGIEPAQAMMVAVHPLDISGAKRAGLQAAWINRSKLPYSAVARRPDLIAGDLLAFAQVLLDHS